MPDTPDGSFLTQKAGPLPVYAWAGAGLGVALLISRFRSANAEKTAKKQDGAPAYSSYANQPEGTIPQFIIQNQLPYVPSAPIVTAPTAPPVVVPPGGSTTPPVTQPTTPPVDTRPPAAPSPAPIPTSPPPPAPAPRQPQWYTVQPGDSLSSIAARFGTTADAIYQYNTTPGNRSAESIATIRSRGPNRIYSGSTFLIP